MREVARIATSSGIGAESLSVRSEEGGVELAFLGKRGGSLGSIRVHDPSSVESLRDWAAIWSKRRGRFASSRENLAFTEIDITTAVTAYTLEEEFWKINLDILGPRGGSVGKMQWNDPSVFPILRDALEEVLDDAFTYSSRTSQLLS